MQYGITFIIGLSIVVIISFIVGVQLKYYSKVNLKFHNKEIDVSNVTFDYKNNVEEI